MSGKYYIFLDGEKFEVSGEVYNIYNRSRRYEKYFMYEKKKGKIIIEEEKIIFKDSLEVSIEKLEQEGIQIKDKFNLEQLVLLKEDINLLKNALATLTDEEYKIVSEIFFNRKSERELAKELNCKRDRIKYLKNKILNKLKKF